MIFAIQITVLIVGMARDDEGRGILMGIACILCIAFIAWCIVGVIDHFDNAKNTIDNTIERTNQ